jgi:RimJ/RimL family protein N-acetyltransferase
VGIAGVRTAPYRIETERCVIRCFDPADAPALVEAVTTSLDHLLPWMPWAESEPQTVEQRVAFIRACRADFDADVNYTYGIFDRKEARVLGGTGLHPRGGPASLEIGYWIRSDALRQGIATEVGAVLTRVAFEVCGVERVDIQIDPENERSTGVPRKLGFVYEATLRKRLDSKKEGGPRRDSLLFTMVRDELSGSRCMSFEYAAFDAAGTLIGP